MGEAKSEVLAGTLDLLLLKLLELGPNHGWGLAERLEAATGGVFCVNQGSVYPALQRLKVKGFVTSSWGVSENGRRARYYELTRGGAAGLRDELDRWARAAGAVHQVIALEPTPELDS